MDIEQRKICRLCFKVAIEEFMEIDEVMRQMFDILSLKLDVSATRDPIVCLDCVEVAKKCLKFKSTCFTTERLILSFSTDTENTKYNIKVIYKDTKDAEVAIDENLDICRICMTQFERNNVVFLDSLRHETNVSVMISECFPEMSYRKCKMKSTMGPFRWPKCNANWKFHFKLKYKWKPVFCVDCTSSLFKMMDFNIIENPMVCTKCRENLELYFMFIVNCLGMERKIKLHCKKEENGSIDQVNSANGPHLFFKDVLESPEKCLQMGKIKEQSIIFEDTNEFIKLEEFEIKEDIDCQVSRRLDINTSTPKEFGIGSKLDTVSIKTIIDNTKEYFYPKVTQENKEDGWNHENALEVNRIESFYMRINEGVVGTHGNKETKYVKSHLLVHKGVSEIKMHKCALCTYESKNKGHLKSHMLVHKSVSEITMHKCTSCAYEAKHKSDLKRHLLVHKDISEITMHKCSFCSYETKQKRGLKNHMLVHKDASEIEMHKCSLCSYEAKLKSSLKIHMLVHKDVSEITMQKCPVCTFETKRKSTLKKHMLVHKRVSEMKIRKCSLCAYESKKECDLKSHFLILHRDFSKLTMHKCPSCDYEAEQKIDLKVHMLGHKYISEMKMHKCSLCAFETKQKRTLKKHMLVHKRVSEMKTYKCSLCSYESEKEWGLKSHLIIVHRDFLKITMHKCPSCAYEAEQKIDLKIHMLGHKDISEIKMHKCSLCA